MVLEQLKYLYSNTIYLDYLRNNPRWYKILHYNPDMFNEFIKEANEKLNLTSKDSLNNFSKKLSFVSTLMQYLAKK